MSAPPYMKPGCNRRLELNPKKFAAATRHLNTTEIGELMELLMAEVALTEVSPPSNQHVADAFAARGDYRRIKGSFGRQSLPLATRKMVFERDGRRCRYCGCELTWELYRCDHVKPVAKRGTDGPDNLAASCLQCNQSKGAKTVAEWRGDA